MTDNDVRRRASRYPMQWKAAVVFDHIQGKPVVHTQTQDLSSNGAAIFSEHGDVTGSIVNLLLAPPGRKKGTHQMVLKAKARIVSSVRQPGMSKYRHGLSFIRTHDDGLDLLDELLGADAGITAPDVPLAQPAKIAVPGDPDLMISQALAKAHRYLRDLVAKLNVARPAYRGRYAVVGVPEFDGLAWTVGHTAMQERQVSPGARRCREVSLNFRLSGGKQISVSRDYPASEKLRRFLEEARIEFKADKQRNARGFAVRTTFAFPCEVAATLLLEGLPDLGMLKLRMTNVCGFGSMEQLLAPHAITDESLAELGAFIVAETRQLGPLLLRGSSMAGGVAAGSQPRR